MKTIRNCAGRAPLRATSLALAGLVLAGVTACSAGSNTASSSASPTTPTGNLPATTPAFVTTTDTTTAVVTSTNVVTSTSVTTPGTTSSMAPPVTHPHPTPGIPCPGPEELTVVLPAADQAASVSAIDCSGEWAVGNYSQDGRNQVVGVFRYGTADGHWALSDPTQVCAQTVNLPPALYHRACQVGAVPSIGGGAPASALGSSKSYSLTQVVKNNSTVELVLQGVPSVDNNATMTPGYPSTIGPQSSGTYTATNSGNGVQMVLKFQTDDARSNVVIDSDVPRTNGNYFNDSITGSGIGFSGTSMTSGDNPTATVIVDSCTSECVKLANGRGDLG